jgi:hypothetical protein
VEVIVGRKYKKKKAAIVSIGSEVPSKAKAEVKPKPEGYVFGRPTDYLPKYCEMIVEYAKAGGSYAAFAGSIQTTRATLNNWAIAHPDFFDAKRTAYYISLEFWEKLGINNIISTSETTKNGKESTTFSKSLNSAVWIYNMKCRFKEEWTEIQKIKQIIDETSKQTQTIKIAYVPKSKRIKTNE